MSAPKVVVLRTKDVEPLSGDVIALRDLGFDVHLLVPGDLEEGDPRIVDGVRVTTVPIRKWLGSGRQGARSPRWTRPLGYRTMAKATVRQAAARARVSEAVFQRDVSLVRSAKPSVVARARLFVARVERRWVAKRADETSTAYRIRRTRQTPAEKVARRWWRLTSRRHAWARLDTSLLEPEVHLGPTLDDVDADVIHAEGAVLMAVALRSASRRSAPIPVVWDTRTDRKPKKPWAVEARRLLIAEYGSRVAAKVNSRNREALVAAYAAAGVPAPSTANIHEGTS